VDVGQGDGGLADGFPGELDPPPIEEEELFFELFRCERDLRHRQDRGGPRRFDRRGIELCFAVEDPGDVTVADALPDAGAVVDAEEELFFELFRCERDLRHRQDRGGPRRAHHSRGDSRPRALLRRGRSRRRHCCGRTA
jgi:hypothetical protein